MGYGRRYELLLPDPLDEFDFVGVGSFDCCHCASALLRVLQVAFAEKGIAVPIELLLDNHDPKLLLNSFLFVLLLTFVDGRRRAIDVLIC